MLHENVKADFSDAVNFVASNISQYTVNLGKDLTRNRKMGADKILTFLRFLQH